MDFLTILSYLPGFYWFFNSLVCLSINYVKNCCKQRFLFPPEIYQNDLAILGGNNLFKIYCKTLIFSQPFNLAKLAFEIKTLKIKAAKII